jgi:hypothetical protein
MKTAVGILCAGLLLAGAGCAWNFGNTRVEADVRVDEQAVDLTLDEAAARVRKELEKRGLEVTVNPDGDAVRVVSRTKTGDQFTVVLNRAHTAYQDRPRAVAGAAGDAGGLRRGGGALTVRVPGPRHRASSSPAPRRPRRGGPGPHHRAAATRPPLRVSRSPGGTVAAGTRRTLPAASVY